MLYSLYSGRGPVAPPLSAQIYDRASLVEWPRVLAALLSNPTKGDANMIRHLGDSLRSHGDVFAAHICYLCCNETPRPASDPLSRFTLLGTEHTNNGQFVTPFAIHVSEVRFFSFDMPEPNEAT